MTPVEMDCEMMAREQKHMMVAGLMLWHPDSVSWSLPLSSPWLQRCNRKCLLLSCTPGAQKPAAPVMPSGPGSAAELEAGCIWRQDCTSQAATTLP